MREFILLVSLFYFLGCAGTCKERSYVKIGDRPAIVECLDGNK